MAKSGRSQPEFSRHRQTWMNMRARVGRTRSGLVEFRHPACGKSSELIAKSSCQSLLRSVIFEQPSVIFPPISSPSAGVLVEVVVQLAECREGTKSHSMSPRQKRRVFGEVSCSTCEGPCRSAKCSASGDPRLGSQCGRQKPLWDLSRGSEQGSGKAGPQSAVVATQG